MRADYTKLQKIYYSALAIVLVASALIPLFNGQAAAAGQVSARSVQLSTSTPAATNAKYTITFTPATSTTIGGIVVDFCGDSPIIGSTTCTLPTGFTLGTSVTLTAGYTGMGTGWATTNSLQGAAAASNKQVAVLTNATPQSLSTGTPVSFELTGITNPSSTGTFYARIYTFDTSANTTANYTAVTTARAANPAGKVDYGGSAMSTANTINVSATVQEQMTFCVSAAAPGASCSGTTTPNIILGTGTPQILTTTATTGTIYHQLTTNAVNATTVFLKVTSSSTCAGLSRDGGATCPIAEKGSIGTIANNSGQFGLHVDAGTGGTGSVTADVDYATASQYAMRPQTYTTYGDSISAASGAVSSVNSLLTYSAATAPSTPAGVYSTTESLIATSSY